MQRITKKQAALIRKAIENDGFFARKPSKSLIDAGMACLDHRKGCWCVTVKGRKTAALPMYAHGRESDWCGIL